MLQLLNTEGNYPRAEAYIATIYVFALRTSLTINSELFILFLSNKFQTN